MLCRCLTGVTDTLEDADGVLDNLACVNDTGEESPTASFQKIPFAKVWADLTYSA
jgi:hypothetical protein